MKIRFFLASFLLASALGAVVSCTPKDKAYRNLPKIDASGQVHNPGCSTAIQLQDGKFGTAEDSTDNDLTTDTGRTSCYLSKYLVPNADKWTGLPNGQRIVEPDRYTLSFVELPERKRTLPDPRQLKDLLSHLSTDEQKVVLVYVHGWRHDAEIGNGNVRRFRTMLGYTRSALNSRCIETGNYCKAKLTGVYVGWRGRSFAESTKKEAGIPGIIGAVPTVWGRKKQSEKLARPNDFNFTFNANPISPIGHVLENIQDRLDLKHGDAEYDKMLTMGHSYGGNMLASYLEPKALELITNHQEKLGTTMKPLLGDMVLLLNPASEAAKWTSIQRKLREVAGVDSSNNWVSSLKDASESEAAQVNRWKKMFPKNQRPFYISLTAAADWSPGEFSKQTRSLEAKYDKATGILFPVSRVFSLESDREKTTAIGHLVPEYRWNEAEGINKVSGLPYGVTHEFIVNRGSGAPTSYENSGNPVVATCGTHDGWLKRAQAIEGFGNAQENWDTGYSGPGSDHALLKNMSNQAEVQFRNALYLSSKGDVKQGRAESVAQGRSPFWNMRGLDTAISDHSNFMNFATFCGINILWLDDATAPNFYKPKR